MFWVRGAALSLPRRQSCRRLGCLRPFDKLFYFGVVNDVKCESLRKTLSRLRTCRFENGRAHLTPQQVSQAAHSKIEARLQFHNATGQRARCDAEERLIRMRSAAAEV